MDMNPPSDTLPEPPAQSAAETDDSALIRRWFERLGSHVASVDYVGARPLFAEDMIAFGTFSAFVTGRDAAEREQWRNVWSRIAEFRWALDDLRSIISGDGLTAVGMAVFTSTGFAEDGSPYDRPGRATVAFQRGEVGEEWIAKHTHMSLFRDVPTQSFGSKSERSAAG